MGEKNQYSIGQLYPPFSPAKLSISLQISPYDFLVLAITISFGMAKAITTYQGATVVPITLEWLSGVVLFLAFYIIGLYRDTIECKTRALTFLFRPICIPCPRLSFHNNSLNVSRIDRLFVTSAVFVFGTSKAFLAYKGFSTATNTVDWVFGVIFTSLTYCLDLYDDAMCEVPGPSKTVTPPPPYVATEKHQISGDVESKMTYECDITEPIPYELLFPDVKNTKRVSREKLPLHASSIHPPIHQTKQPLMHFPLNDGEALNDPSPPTYESQYPPIQSELWRGSPASGTPPPLYQATEQEINPEREQDIADSKITSSSGPSYHATPRALVRQHETRSRRDYKSTDGVLGT